MPELTLSRDNLIIAIAIVLLPFVLHRVLTLVWQFMVMAVGYAVNTFAVCVLVGGFLTVLSLQKPEPGLATVVQRESARRPGSKPQSGQARVPTGAAVEAWTKPAPLIYTARHKHFLGRCEGQLHVADGIAQYVSKSHFLTTEIRDIDVHRASLRAKSGKWRFTVPGYEPEKLLAQWRASTTPTTAVLAVNGGIEQ